MRIAHLRYVRAMMQQGTSCWEVFQARMGRRNVVVKVGLLQSKVWANPWHEADILSQLPEDTPFFPTIYGRGQCTLAELAEMLGASEAHLVKVFSIGENKVDPVLDFTLDAPRPPLRGHTKVEPERVVCSGATPLAFIVEELVLGEPLDALVQDQGAGDYLRLLIKAVRLMEDAGVTHNDLHMGNVLIRNGCPVIIDFDRATSERYPAKLPEYLLSHGQDARYQVGRDMLLFIYYVFQSKLPERWQQRLVRCCTRSTAPADMPWEEAMAVEPALKGRWNTLKALKRDARLCNSEYVASLMDTRYLQEHF